MNFLRLPLLRQATAALLVAGLLLQSATAVAPGPAWWGTQTVLDPYALADDFAAANTGQLKYLAAKAAAALEADFPGGAGTAIQTLIASWNTAPASGVLRDDYLAINQGQLKAVAALFYDRLGQPYPWAGSSAVRDDYQLVNLGQLKHVFSFALHSRTAGQGAVQIPAATLAAALAQWQALPVKPAGSSADDFDGDGIPNLQEYLMGGPLFDPLDLDGDRIPDTTEDAHPGVLSKLRFADAVEDADGDGVMNGEELQLGLSLSTATTSGRADGLGDSAVLAWGLAAGQPLAASTDAVAWLWGQIDAAWITANAGDYYFYWLDQTLVGGVPAGLSSFRSDVFDNWIWQPWKPGVGDIENPSPAHDQNGNTVDLDGNGVPDFDRDIDGLPDLWEYRYSLNLRSSQDSQSDPDGDALTNMQEYAAGTNPRLADSDGDGFSDGVELAQVAQGADPLNGAAGLPLVVQFVGGSYQAIYSGQTTPALAVQVTQGGQPVAGVSVAFQVEAGAGRLRPASSTAGTPGSSLSQTTASDGIAAVTYESVAGEAEGTASISAVLAGVAARTFIVSIVAIPVPYGSDGAGGGDNVGGSNPARVPTPLRSTAASAASTAAASADGIRIRVKRRFDTDAGYPLVDLFPEYLSSYGLNPAAVVGWQDAFETHSWGDYTRLDFEPLLPVAVPFARPMVPGGARRYLVLVNQGVDVDLESSGPPLYVGSLTFSYTDTGVRVISLSRGSIPNEFMTVNGNESVSFEPPLASGAEGRVWIRLVPFELKIWNGQDAAAAVPENKKYTVGAFTVANLNDTDGDGGVNNTLDKDDNVVTKEKDLMKLYVGGYAGLTGKVKLTVKSGKERVKFWETKEKVTPIELDATGSLFYDIPAGGIGKILWVEVIAASVAVRDIEIWQGYQDAQGNLQDGLDKVKATAVWVDPGANGIITAGNQIPRDLDDLTAIRTFQNLHDSKFGIFDASPGKRQFSYSIGFEFKVKPAGIGNEPGIKFDVSRQRETIAWVKDNQVWFGGATAPFPTTPDEPNDDNHSEDEDNMPTNDHIYSMDNPLVPFLPAPGERAVKRGNFREFVRVFLDGQDFLNLNGKLEGSRCSNFQDWRMRGDITKTNSVWNLSPGGSNELQGGHVPLGAHP